MGNLFLGEGENVEEESSILMHINRTTLKVLAEEDLDTYIAMIKTG